MKSNKKWEVLRFNTVPHIDSAEDVRIGSMVAYIPRPYKTS